ncbi:probable proteasome subunit beta type-2 [Teleopsis dalmanni]|uniref:probable proteasome subunit beta type-2 n=1 Tax=Teleopsis dalmanni TaxID=139649 RepID=UPI0018CD5264|nr:probable proteasome subunit beta type-2 [Teleopsis dalmanni]
METVLGIKGRDFVMVAADTTYARSIVVMKEDENKIFNVSDNILMAAIGDAGDCVQFIEFIEKNVALYKMSNGYELTPKSAAHYTRRNLADYLRSHTPFHVNMLVAGFDPKEGPELQFIDYLASANSVNFAGHGYGSMFCSSIFDRYYHADITREEAYDVMKKCVIEIQKRLLVSLNNFKVAMVDKDGIQNLELINSKSLKEHSEAA